MLNVKLICDVIKRNESKVEYSTFLDFYICENQEDWFVSSKDVNNWSCFPFVWLYLKNSMRVQTHFA